MSKKIELQVEKLNAKYPVGSKFYYHPVAGEMAHRFGWMLPLSDEEQKTLWDWMNAEDRNIQHLIDALGEWVASPPKDETFSTGDFPPGLWDLIQAERRHVDEDGIKFLRGELKTALKQLKPAWRATIHQILRLEDGLLTLVSPFDAVAARADDIIDYYENACESKLLYLCPLPPKLTEVRSEAHNSAAGIYPYESGMRRRYGSPRGISVKLNTPAGEPLRHTPEGTPCALYFDDLMDVGIASKQSRTLPYCGMVPCPIR